MRARIAIAAAVACVIGAIGAPVARADLTYDFTFGGNGTGAGQFSNATGVAVNHTTGDVYVSDTDNNRVQQFDAGGNFIRMWGRGVDQDTGANVCTAVSGHTCKAGETGGAAGAFNSPRGIGIDNSGGPASGAVYVQDTANNRIQKFSAGGTFVLTWGKAVNLDTGGDLCTAASGNTCKSGNTSGVAGDPQAVPPIPDLPSTPGEFAGWSGTLASVPQLAVDGNGFIYVNEPNAIPEPRVQKFDSDGDFVGQIAPGDTTPQGINFSRGIATNAEGDVYVLDAIAFDHGIIKRFDAGEFDVDGTAASAAQLFADRTQPRIAAIDPSNDFLLVWDNGSACSQVGPEAAHLREFASTGQQVDCSIPVVPSLEGTTGMAASVDHRLYAAVGSEIRVFDLPASAAPAVASFLASSVASKGATITAQVAAHLSETDVHVKYGLANCSLNACTTAPDSDAIGAALAPTEASISIQGLTPGTTYHYRVIAENGKGSDTSPDGTFTTFPTALFDPSCPNNLARQQTGAAFILDCRAYELVSAENSGGYNVESNLVDGQTPFNGYPLATGKALYAVHNGGIPGTGKPTNRGLDPYVATRDEANRRWVTKYVGIPADAPSNAPFSSTLAGADAGLSSFAFSGPDLCDPCFADGTAGIPIRLPDGSLVQGMAGSLPVASPEPSGGVKKHLSADGSHFLFASTQQFEPAGNSNGTDVTIYERDLNTDTTEVVSTLPGGATIANGTDVEALNVSNNGSRVLIGAPVKIDADGNVYYDLYLREAGSPDSIQIASAGDGALYAGMSADGSQVYFTTTDNLADDTDGSADLFRATVSGGAATIERVSSGTGDAGNTDLCNPSANSYNNLDWNVLPGRPTDCSVVAIGGGGGVAPASGAVYLLSPEKLDGNGQPGSPNLFLARPGEAPQFVATLESSASTPLGLATHGVILPALGAAANPGGTAIDGQNGSIYIYSRGSDSPREGGGAAVASVKKYTAAGTVATSFDGDGTLGGFWADGANALNADKAVPTSIAVDNGPGSSNRGDLYVPEDSDTVKRFSSTGALEDEITVGGGLGAGDYVTAVATHPTNGDLYVGVGRFLGFPGSARVYVFDPNGDPVNSFDVSGTPLGIAVDSTGRVYVADGAATKAYVGGTFDHVLNLVPPAYGVAVDPTDDHVYVDQGNQIVEFDPVGNKGAPFGSLLGGSVSLSAYAGKLAASINKGGLFVGALRFGPPSTPAGRAYDSPLVIDSVRAAGIRHPDEFQLSRDGSYAALPSVLALDGGSFDSAGKQELFRYRAADGQIACASCNPTGQRPASDATLTADGSSLTDDGRVFFTTTEPLVLRDANEKKDAYEWKEGKVELVSTGRSPFDSGLLSVTADGTDAFFFTREKLTSNDGNGNLVKLYDARADGGFFVIPPAPKCAASDECHGAGSSAPAPPMIGTVSSPVGNLPPKPKPCPKGKRKVKRHGKVHCVKRKKHHRKRHAHHKRQPRRKHNTERVRGWR
ncbi:MAG TPA: hypothetical protein VF176_03140 [Solirubrobacterales bacterium]